MNVSPVSAGTLRSLAAPSRPAASGPADRFVRSLSDGGRSLLVGGLSGAVCGAAATAALLALNGGPGLGEVMLFGALLGAVPGSAGAALVGAVRGAAGGRFHPLLPAVTGGVLGGAAAFGLANW